MSIILFSIIYHQNITLYYDLYVAFSSEYFFIAIKQTSNENYVFFLGLSKTKKLQFLSVHSDKHARHAMLVEIKIRIIDIACEP